MPGKYVVVDGGRLVIEKWVGKTSCAEIMAYEKHRAQDASIADGAKLFSDARAGEFTKTSDEFMQKVFALREGPDCKAHLSVWAAVLQASEFEQARIWEAEAGRRGVRAVIFTSFDVACTYLGIDPVETQELLDSIEP